MKSKNEIRPMGLMTTATGSMLGQAPTHASTAAPIFTKERAEAIRVHTAEWVAKNEPGMTAEKVEAYLRSTELFKL